MDSGVGEPITELCGEVVETRPEYTFIKLPSEATGLVGTVSGKPALLDGGIPYYGWMGAHLPDPPETGDIHLIGKKIASITQVFKDSCKADCTDFSFTVGGEPILGLSLTIQPKKLALLKILPRKRGSLEYALGDWVKIELITESS